MRAHSGADGRFELVLPYGTYRLTVAGLPGEEMYVAPLRTVRIRVPLREPARPPAEDVAWPFSLDGFLLALEPSIVADPLDFSGLWSMRLPLISDRAFSWTDTRYARDGMNATDPYQPGRLTMFPDMQAVSDVALRSGLDRGTSPAYGSEVAVFAREPGAAWHGGVSTSDTGEAAASDNLSAAAVQNGLRQSDRFRWFTHDNLELGGPLGRRADLYLSGTGQWASRSIPPAPGQDMNSRLLFGNVRGRVSLSREDLFEAQANGSRIDLSDWGTPAGLEALLGLRIGLPVVTPWGVAGVRETDHLDFVQAGWTRQLLGPERVGALQVRYAFSTAHLDSMPSARSARRRAG